MPVRDSSGGFPRLSRPPVPGEDSAEGCGNHRRLGNPAGGHRVGASPRRRHSPASTGGEAAALALGQATPRNDSQNRGSTRPLALERRRPDPSRGRTSSSRAGRGLWRAHSDEADRRSGTTTTGAPTVRSSASPASRPCPTNPSRLPPINLSGIEANRENVFGMSFGNEATMWIGG